MVKDHSANDETHYRYFMGYSFPLKASNILHAPSHRQDSTYHGICGITPKA